MSDTRGATPRGGGGGVGGFGDTSSSVAGTATIVSGTAAQVSVSRDIHLLVPVTFNPNTTTAATCQVAISPDGSTFTTLVTDTVPAQTLFVGTVRHVFLLVPKGWWVRFTTANAALGTPVTW